MRLKFDGHTHEKGCGGVSQTPHGSPRAQPLSPPPDQVGAPESLIRIRVRPYADLARFFPGEGRIRVIETTPGTTVGDLLDSHGLDESRRLTLGVNDVLASRATQLRDGDTLEVLVPMSGGM